MATIHPIPPGYWCVPSAIIALTGEDGQSVVQPAINRHAKAYGLLDLVVGVSMPTARAVLEELGYRVRAYRGAKLRAHLATWARRSAERYPGRALLVATRDHALVVSDGRVYDTFTPAGAAGARHPYARTTVVWAALVEKA